MNLLYHQSNSRLIFFLFCMLYYSLAICINLLDILFLSFLEYLRLMYILFYKIQLCAFRTFLIGIELNNAIRHDRLTPFVVFFDIKEIIMFWLNHKISKGWKVWSINKIDFCLFVCCLWQAFQIHFSAFFLIFFKLS